MLKCPSCGRTGGPFRLRHQIQADNQILRNWGCPCGHMFHASAGAERAASGHSPYTGFTVDWNGRPQLVALRRMAKHETVWSVGDWSIMVMGPPDGPGTRMVSVRSASDEPVGEWKLQPGWGPSEITRRLKVWPLPPELPPDLLARVLARVLG